MACPTRSNAKPPLLPPAQNTSGIALFMVIAAVGVLSILVSEFTYISQISQMIAFGGADQAKAHYLAKSGLKLSLLRLKAYQQVKTLVRQNGAAGAAVVPKGMIEKIWNFPFFYPIPTAIPGLSTSDKERIEAFQKNSNLDGKFSAIIESESSKYNLNSLLAGFVPTGTPSSTPSSTPSTTPTPAATTPPADFNPQAARESLYNFLNTLLLQKTENDADFATAFRDFRLDEFVDGVAGWADRTYERRTNLSRDLIPMKKAPFYSLTELHMLPNFEDELYDLFAPSLTVSPTPGVNVNMLQEVTLRALIPAMSKDEVTAFFKYRDDPEVDHLFASEDRFFDYLSSQVMIFKNNPQYMVDFKKQLVERNIRIVTDETSFKITVQAQVNIATRKIEVWVTLSDAAPPAPGGVAGGTGALPPGGNPAGGITPDGQVGTPPPPSTGLKINYMRIT